MCTFGVLFSACKKEPIFEPNQPTVQTVENRSATTVGEVNVVLYELNSNVLTVSFSGFDLSNSVILQTAQTLEFSNETSTVYFNSQVSGSSVDGENLEIDFDFQEVDFSGFEIEETQSIIIVDGAFE